MRILLKWLTLAICILIVQNGFSRGVWPREIVTPGGVVITLYQPQNESMDGNILKSRTVITIKKSKKEEPVFGVFWSDSKVNTDLDTRMATLANFVVTDLKFPDTISEANLKTLKTLLEEEIPKWNLEVSVDEITATLENNPKVQKDEFNTEVPKIIYANKLTTLILIDGKPIIKMDDKLKMEKVINTPFLIVKEPVTSYYYLYVGKYWYKSKSIDKGWSVASEMAASIEELNAEILQKAKESAGQGAVADSVATDIIVSKEPAELIQTVGREDFASIPGTILLYATNSPNNIFKYVQDQNIYILLSGRWFKSAKIEGPWSYVPSDKLPAEFAKIPEGSEKDIVLASVAGTDAAREAVMEAQIPQTAKVDRNTAKCTVTFDGEPKFEAIEGTELWLASNASLTVLRSENKYYAVDNGVWFVSDNAAGPWAVSENRPADVDKIPAQNQAYNVKYVYVYDSTPEYVYMGYTPGYMGCYVYGSTVIYGTGYYYPPYYGSVYYPYPATYGYGMYYNPYAGWGMAVTIGFAYGAMYGGYYGGYWGPPMYHPPYHHHHPGGGGYYGHGNRPAHYDGYGPRVSNGMQGNNIYNQRNGVSTRPAGAGNAGNARPSTSDMSGNRASAGTRDIQAPSRSSKASNNMYSDRSGNVYRNDKSGNWQQRSNNSWSNAGSSNRQQLDQSQQMRDRSNTRTNQSRQNSSSSYGGSRSMGSSGMRSGGGGRRR